MSDSLQLHGLHSPWNSPGQKTGVGSLFLLQGISETQGWIPGLPHCGCILHKLSHQGSPIITRVGSLSLFQRIFLTQKSNQSLLNCRWILYQLSHEGSPRIPKWVAYPFSSGSSQPRNQTGVYSIVGGFFTSWTSWTTREALNTY